MCPKKYTGSATRWWACSKPRKRSIPSPLAGSTRPARAARSGSRDSGRAGRYFAQLHQLLFKIKTIQDISLTTLYYLSGQEEGVVKEVAAQNKGRFESEMAQFEQRLKERF
jgi:hypothetical protein